METPLRVEFCSGDLTLVGEQYRADAGRGLVFLLHGGGQTRHSWRTLAHRLAAMGWCATTLDARGHGDSSWDPAGNYTLEAMAIDLEECFAGQEPPVVIGASLGGLAGLIAVGERKVPARALVLVDVTPAVEAKGAARIRSFMSAHLGGFESLADVQKAISAYKPRSGEQSATSSSRGLLNVVRQREDGRWYWHWDPAMLIGRDAAEPFHETERMYRAARSVTVPTLLIRGKLSDVVSPEAAQEFLKVAPNARLVDVSDASHMLAGDNNELFEDAVIDFLDTLPAVNDASQWARLAGVDFSNPGRAWTAPNLSLILDMAKERMRSVRPAQENLIDAAGTESYSGDAWLGASDRALASPDIPVTDSLVPAVVVPARGRRVDVEALRSALRERLRSSLTPRIWIWDSLPRTETGKLVRRDIVRTLSEVADQSIADQGE